MPVFTNPFPSRLVLRLLRGTDPNTGRALVSTVGFGNLRRDASLENIYATAQDLAGLLELSLYSVEKSDRAELLSA